LAKGDGTAGVGAGSERKPPEEKKTKKNLLRAFTEEGNAQMGGTNYDGEAHSRRTVRQTRKKRWGGEKKEIGRR